MNIDFERLANGNVRITRNGSTTTVSGSATIETMPNLHKIYVYFLNRVDDFAIDYVKDTISKNGGAAIVGKDPIQQALEEDIFYAPGGSGGGAVDSVNGHTGVVNLDLDDIGDGETNKTLNEANLLAQVQQLDGYDFATPKAVCVEGGELKLLPVQINEL